MEIEIRPELRATIGKSILEGDKEIRYCIRREPKHENDSGWLFASFYDAKNEQLSDNDFLFVDYAGLVEHIQPLLKYLLLFPVGADVKIENTGGGKFYIVDSETNKNIDYIKYSKMESGTPLSEAIVKRSGVLSRLLGL